MTEIDIEFSCSQCMTGAYARGSLAIHPTYGAAIVTCYHGPVDLRHKCSCVQKSPIFAGGEVATVLDSIEKRDVAWLSLPKYVGKPRAVSPIPPSAGGYLTALLPSGPVRIRVAAIVGRDDDSHPPYELALDRNFAGGESGSPILNEYGEVLAVVRDQRGRCGYVDEEPSKGKK